MDRFLTKRKHSPSTSSSSSSKKQKQDKAKQYEAKRPDRTFRESWKVGRKWLEYDPAIGMTCSV